VVQSATESVYNLVGVRRGVAKVGHKGGNLGLCCCGWQTVGSAPDEKSFHGVVKGETGVLWCPFRDQKGNSGLRCREQARRVYYGAVFEIKKEIPDKYRLGCKT
jgi:hypothetical protein